MGFDEKVVVWVRARSCNHTFHKTIEVSSTKIENGRWGDGVIIKNFKFQLAD
jgi:hypothetical protein